MPLIQWKNEFAIGIPAVDHEHQGMIALINALHDSLSKKTAARGEVVDMLGEIHARIAAHFALEEREMRQMRYDQFSDHKEDHEFLLDEIREIMDDVELGGAADYATSLSQRLERWFSEHFRTHDARLHRFLEGRN